MEFIVGSVVSWCGPIIFPPAALALKKRHGLQACLPGGQVIVPEPKSMQTLVPKARRLENRGDGLGGHLKDCSRTRHMP